MRVKEFSVPHHCNRIQRKLGASEGSRREIQQRKDHQVAVKTDII